MAESKALCESTAEADDQWLHSKAFPELAPDFAAHLPQWAARHALGTFLESSVFRRSGKCKAFCWEKCFGTSLKDPPKNGDILLMENNLHQLRSVVYPIIYKVSYISGGARFLPSPVSHHIPEKLDNSSTGSPGLKPLPGYTFWREAIM